MNRIRPFAALLRWLGPWTNETRAPSDVTRAAWVIRDGELHGHRAYARGVIPDETKVAKLEAYVYTPERSLALYVVSPGLHFAGPDDVRLDRFCRVLAHAGFTVVAPFLPTFVDLRVAESAADDLEATLLAARARFPELGKATLFSISFGSWPALEVAARRPNDVDSVITFGGYADFESVVRFCADGVMHTDAGPVAMAFDPLNMPALFVNVQRFIEVPGDPARLVQAYREMCYRTWGRMELKEKGKLTPYIEAIARELPECQREIFRRGAGGGDAARADIERALANGKDALAFLNPTRALAHITCPVVVCHGREDDVIPWNESEKLHRALSARVPSELHLTGLYAHTGQGRPKLADLAREARTLLALARAIANGGRLSALLGAPQ
jgi:pimeloyl-ACP methyl ester carboxylesterase